VSSDLSTAAQHALLAVDTDLVQFESTDQSSLSTTCERAELSNQLVDKEGITINRTTPDILSCTSDKPHSTPNLEKQKPCPAREYKNNSVTNQHIEIVDHTSDESIVRNLSGVAYTIYSPSRRAVDQGREAKGRRSPS
jgi:hypothetical protein